MHGVAQGGGNVTLQKVFTKQMLSSTLARIINDPSQQGIIFNSLGYSLITANYKVTRARF